MTSSQKILLSLILTSFLVTGCATSYSKEELRTVDNALRTGDGGHLTGKLGYLYRKESRKLRVEQAARCLLYTSPSPRDATLSRMPSSA